MGGVVRELEKGQERYAVRYPCCKRGGECSRPCACKEAFFRKVVEKRFPVTRFKPILIDGCGDFETVFKGEEEDWSRFLE